MTQPATILQLVPALETGGAERTTIDISAALVAEGWTSLVASAGGRMLPDLTATGADHIEMPLEARNPVSLIRNAGRIASLIRERNVDLIHARSRGPAWSALIAARRTGTPFVTTYHGAYGQTNAAKALYNSVMARADSVIANSSWTKALVSERHPWAKDRIVAIPRGTDFAQFDRNTIGPERLEALRTAWKLPDGALVFLHLARLTGWKGQQVVIDAAARIASEVPNAIFVLAGDAQGRDDYLTSLNDSIAQHGLQERVRLPGHCSDPAAAMALADIVIVASTKPEAFGRAAVEAAALARPAIVTRLGAVEETVLAPPEVSADERTGWKVPPFDVAAMADAMREVATMPPAEREAVGARALRHAHEHFSLKSMSDATLAVYRKLLAL